jgi:hypothetical protein
LIACPRILIIGPRPNLIQAAILNIHPAPMHRPKPAPRPRQIRLIQRHPRGPRTNPTPLSHTALLL